MKTKYLSENNPPKDAELVENRFSCCLIFYVTLREFSEIKKKLGENLPKLVYQRISVDPLWCIPQGEVKN